MVRDDNTMTAEAEADTFERVIDPEHPVLTPTAAEALLALGSSESDHDRTADVAAKSNGGTLTPTERRELQGYVFVGDLLSLLKSKARLSLRQPSPAA